MSEDFETRKIPLGSKNSAQLKAALRKDNFFPSVKNHSLAKIFANVLRCH